jgi:hypothetical protein
MDVDIHFRCYYHFYNVPQLTGLLAAAMTLVYDLGLNRPAPREASSLFEDALRESISNPYRPSLMRARTLEEQRTFMGCFFLDSVYELYPLAVFKTLDATNIFKDLSILSQSGFPTADSVS